MTPGPGLRSAQVDTCCKNNHLYTFYLQAASSQRTEITVLVSAFHVVADTQKLPRYFLTVSWLPNVVTDKYSRHFLQQ